MCLVPFAGFAKPHSYVQRMTARASVEPSCSVYGGRLETMGTMVSPWTAKTLSVVGDQAAVSRLSGSDAAPACGARKESWMVTTACENCAMSTTMRRKKKAEDYHTARAETAPPAV